MKTSFNLGWILLPVTCVGAFHPVGQAAPDPVKTGARDIFRPLDQPHPQGQELSRGEGAPVLPTLNARGREIFVAGCGHSGTTLMLRLIGTHHAIMPIQVSTC